VQGYNSILNISGNGIMGYVSIPKLGVELPLYHGISAEVLNVACGHLEGTSLPIGGESTHSVLTGHSAIPGMMLFTDLEDMIIGDKFYIKILDEVLAYEVDQIEVVLPNDTSKLQIVEGKDYVTLLTCTPYAINTHRLLVRGIRTDYNGEIDEPDTKTEKEDSLTTSATTESSSKIDDSKLSLKFKLYYLVTPSIISVVLIVLFITIYKNRKRIKEKILRKREKKNEA
jgi:LPXTG-site transpeptidase (sortase) family protein